MEKRKLAILGIAGLSLILAASITMTVAWYNGSSYLAINQINVGLVDKDLKISIDNEDFKHFIPTEDLMEVGRFRAVSTMFCDDWMSRKEELPIFKGAYGASAKNVVNDVEDSHTISGGYFCQNFYLWSDYDVYATLDKELTTFKCDEEGNRDMIQELREKYPGLSDEEIYDNLNRVIESLRISLLVLNDSDDDSGTYPDYAYHIVDPFKNKITYMCGILDSDKNGYYDYSQENKEVLYGECYSSDSNKTVEECVVYHEPTLYATHVSSKELTCFTSGNKEGVRKIDFEASKTNGLVLQEEKSVALEEAEDKILIPLRANISKRIILSFYQEGWDFENTDFVKYSHFFVNVMFKIARPLY